MFHVLPYGETTWSVVPKPPAGGESGSPRRGEVDAHGQMSDFDAGVLVGILVGEGHFGGDGRQPQVTLRMHSDHAALFEWLMGRFPDSRLYGPYDHAGRHYYQWMARGAYLRETLVPLLDAALSAEIDEPSYQRYQAMKERYGL